MTVAAIALPTDSDKESTVSTDETPVEYEETVAVYAAPDAVTAEIVRGALEGEGILAVIGEQVTDALAGPFAVGESFWGEVRVNAADEAAARAVVAAFESGEGGFTDEELAAQAAQSEDPGV